MRAIRRLGFLPLVLALCGSAPAAEAVAPEAVLERLEARIRAVEPRLRSESIGHYALLHDLDEADLLRAMGPVSFRRDGKAFVLGVGGAVEPHGGGIAALLFSQWRPRGRPATHADRFPFRTNGEALALGSLYEGHKLQLFLPAAPAPGTADAGAHAAASPGHALPRMVFFAAEPAVPDVERDAFAALELVVARERDYTAVWTNHLGQPLSVDILLRSVWDHYLHAREPVLEHRDHSHLHLPSLLLAYRRGLVERHGDPSGLDLDEIRSRFLEVELARKDADDEALAHYAESLGAFAAEPGLCWDAAQRERVAAWVEALGGRTTELERGDPAELTHLVRGLRGLRLHGGRLSLAGEDPCAAGAPGS